MPAGVRIATNHDQDHHSCDTQSIELPCHQLTVDKTSGYALALHIGSISVVNLDVLEGVDSLYQLPVIAVTLPQGVAGHLY